MVLITGAAGEIGSTLVEASRDRYDLRLVDRRPVPGEARAVIADVTDPDAVRPLVEGVEVVIHLAANASWDASFDELLGPNLVAPYVVFQAAADAGVRRVIFASSCHTVLAYLLDAAVRPDQPVRPSDVYGVTKVYGEVLGHYFHETRGLEFLGVRIGAFARPGSRWLLRGAPEVRASWLSPRDAVEFFRRAVETPGIGYAIINATSRNDPQWLSLDAARELLGYEPRDDVCSLLNSSAAP